MLPSLAKYLYILYNIDMEFKIYDSLPQQAVEIRTNVFVKEQGFEEEFDSVDKIAAHIVVFDQGRAVATCRFYQECGYYLIGRIAVSSEYRGMGLGAKMLRYAQDRIRELGGREIRIHSQKRAEGFYQKQGFESLGNIDYDEGCEHIWMKKVLH